MLSYVVVAVGKGHCADLSHSVCVQGGPKEDATRGTSMNVIIVTHARKWPGRHGRHKG
jgi:hypothetical protein